MALLRSETRIYGNATVDTFLKIDGNNTSFPATSNTTGALRVAGGIGVIGNVFSSGNITALNADLGNLTVANYFTGTLTTANQYNITNVGTLGNVTVTNSANVGTLNATDGVFTGNLTVSGNFVYANVVTLNIKDPIIEQGGNTNGTALTTDDNKDRGSLLHYYDGIAIDAFMGWDNSNSEFAFGSNVSVAGEVVTFNSYGNIRANHFLGNIIGSSETAVTVTGNAQPNITSVGTLNYLNVSNLNGGNGTVTANYFAGIVTTSHQPNINSLGILSNITVNGPAILGNVADVTIYGGTSGQYLKTDGNGVVTWSNITGAYSNTNAGAYLSTYTGNLTAGNADLGNAVIANYFVGNGSQLTGLTATSATTAGTVTTNAQPNITSVGTLTSLNVSGNVNFTGPNVSLGNVSNLHITGGTNGYVLITDGNGNLSWAAGASGSGNANVAGSNTQIQYNDGTNLAASANLTFNNTSKTLTVDKISVTDLSVTGNVTSNLIPSVDSTYDLGSSSRKFKDLYLSGNSLHLSDLTVTANNGNLSLPNTVFSGKTFVSNVSNLNISGGTSGYILSTDGSGNLNWVSAGNALQSSGGLSIVSTISNIVAGSAIDISVSYADANFPGGTYTIAQLGPVTLSATDIWYTGSTSKNAYANFIASSVNTQNVNVTFTLTNATFNVQSSDYINIGSSNVTGANLVALNITANGTYTIPSAYLTAANTQTNSTVAVNARITTSRGVFTATGTSLTNNQPVPFNVTALSGSFGSATVPYFSLNQTFNWNATSTSGATVASGNVTYANTVNSISGSLTSVGATSGTSVSLDSTMNYTITSSDYFGSGQYGAGSRTMTATINGTVTAATKYYPLFYQITSSNQVPSFTTSTTRLSANVAIGTSATTSATPSYYLWMATPSTNLGVLSGANRTFKHVFLGSDIVDTPDVASETTISGQSYNIYGFTNFSVATPILVTG